MDISELELVQITIILLMMIFILVAIICLLSHHWLPALAFLSRLNYTQRDQAAQMMMCRHLDNGVPSFMQQQQLCHLQPTYPYLQQDIINLPPIICLSDGEELLSYKGPCRLQLHPPEQQLELRRPTVCAPPNKTVFDIVPKSIYIHDSNRSSSSNSGTNNVIARMEGSPPPYTELMGDCPDSKSCYCQYSNNVTSTVNKSGVVKPKKTIHSGSSGTNSTTQVSID